MVIIGQTETQYTTYEMYCEHIDTHIPILLIATDISKNYRSAGHTEKQTFYVTPEMFVIL